MCFGGYERDNPILLSIQHEMGLLASELYPLADLSFKDYTTPDHIVPSEDARESRAGFHYSVFRFLGEACSPVGLYGGELSFSN